MNDLDKKRKGGVKIYLNGEFKNKEELNEILEPGFLFGWGAFETMRAYNKKVPFLVLHIERLNKSLALLGVEEVNFDFKKIIDDLLLENSLTDAYVRASVYKKRKSNGVIIYAAKFDEYNPQTYQKGFSAIISDHRFDTKSISWKVKSLSYLEKRLVWHQAQGAKKDEALVRNLDGSIVGGARSNLFLIKANKAIIPAKECGAFSGITKDAVIKILEKLGIDIVERKIELGLVGSCDEAFLSSSLLEVMPLVACENNLLGRGEPGELSLKVLSEYRRSFAIA